MPTKMHGSQETFGRTGLSILTIQELSYHKQLERQLCTNTTRASMAAFEKSCRLIKINLVTTTAVRLFNRINPIDLNLRSFIASR